MPEPAQPAAMRAKKVGGDRLAADDVGYIGLGADRVGGVVRKCVVPQIHAGIEPAFEIGDLPVALELVELALVDEPGRGEVMALQSAQDHDVQIIDISLIVENTQRREVIEGQRDPAFPCPGGGGLAGEQEGGCQHHPECRCRRTYSRSAAAVSVIAAARLQRSPSAIARHLLPRRRVSSIPQTSQ
jgi:hypothetical protein